jgi:hypothetical protein
MDNALPYARHSFRAYFIRMHGPESGLTVRMLLVEAANERTVYEGIGSWAQCVCWIVQLSGWIVPREMLSLVRKRVEQKQLAAINVMLNDVRDIESAGLSRVDG